MDDLSFDANHIWHPYTGLPSYYEIFEVSDTQGVYIYLSDGTKLVDGMASWWSAIHGYKNPKLQQALHQQVEAFPHVMFGGLTHKPAINLARKLIEITPENLEQVFFADSGSVAVEVAMKMALQYQVAKGQKNKHKFITLSGGYHGDTMGAMSVCDPDTGMHGLFADRLASTIFVPRPSCTFGDDWDESSMVEVKQILAKHHEQIAAFILEPIVQGAGGMYFYHPQYLTVLRKLCEDYGILLIADEIATGFGRTGKLFACEWAEIDPDILCVGKALTGGTMTLAATLTTKEISETISRSPPHVLMHGPTFMANPLACAVALASLELLQDNHWQDKVKTIEKQLNESLINCEPLAAVSKVRVIGAIGVVELKQPIDMKLIQPLFVQKGVWVRPFGKLVYIMPAYTISRNELDFLCQAIYEVCAEIK